MTHIGVALFFCAVVGQAGVAASGSSSVPYGCFCFPEPDREAQLRQMGVYPYFCDDWLNDNNRSAEPTEPHYCVCPNDVLRLEELALGEEAMGGCLVDSFGSEASVSRTSVACSVRRWWVAALAFFAVATLWLSGAERRRAAALRVARCRWRPLR